MSAIKTDCGIFTDPGGRPVNEDFADMLMKKGARCFVLCDGLGGHGMGDKASRFVARFVLREFARCTDIGAFITRVLPDAQTALREEQARKGITGKMKTTAVVLVLDDESAYCAHIGDSRLYRFRGGVADFRTRDHSIPQMLVMTGEIGEEQIRSHPDRNKLLRALGDDREEIKCETARLDLRPGDAFLLCSDGFWEPVTEDEMLALLSSCRSAKDWVSKMAALAVRNSAGSSMDNYTAVGVMVKG